MQLNYGLSDDELGMIIGGLITENIAYNALGKYKKKNNLYKLWGKGKKQEVFQILADVYAS